MPKFICVKSIIFLTFFQGLILAILVYAGYVRPEEDYSAHNISYALQNCLLCWEMPFFAWMHYYSFPWTDYDCSRLSSRLSLTFAIRDALGMKDIMYDTYSTFYAAPQRSVTHEREPLMSIWDDDEPVNERTPIRQCLTSYNESDRTSLEFPDPCNEDERDFEAGRRLIYGDFNFPVIHEDPRFSAPPVVLSERSNHINDYTKRLEGQQTSNSKKFESSFEIEDRLLGWSNPSRSDILG